MIILAEITGKLIAFAIAGGLIYVGVTQWGIGIIH